MPAPAPNKPYRWLAQYYDTIFTLHLPWFAAARERILGKILPRVTAACDLACGTGTTAVLLAHRGIRMYGVDLSTAMCRLAREKVRRARVPVTILHADMRKFRLPEPVDLVSCEFDALNHIPRKEDLAQVAQSVSRALRPGGWFYFDVNNRRAFEKVWPGTWFIEQPGVAMVMRGGYDQARDRGWTDVEWFCREGRLWRRHHEHVEQVAWTRAEVSDTLRAAGFAKVDAWDATLFRSDPRMDRGCRTFYLARRKA